MQEAIPALAELAGMIGDPHVRNRGTIGGSVANNDPAADYPAACLALGATIVTNKRKIAADDFFKGLFETALEEGEIITRSRFPIPQKAAYAKFRNPASRYALVGVFVAQARRPSPRRRHRRRRNGVFRWAGGGGGAEEALRRRSRSRASPHPAEGPQRRHPRRRRLPRPPDRRDGQARGRGRDGSGSSGACRRLSPSRRA